MDGIGIKYKKEMEGWNDINFNKKVRKNDISIYNEYFATKVYILYFSYSLFLFL